MSGLGLSMAECPEEIGLSAERVERIHETLRQDVERCLIPGGSDADRPRWPDQICLGDWIS